jgi:hypothetical protein
LACAKDVHAWHVEPVNSVLLSKRIENEKAQAEQC